MKKHAHKQKHNLEDVKVEFKKKGLKTDTIEERVLKKRKPRRISDVLNEVEEECNMDSDDNEMLDE